MAERRENIDELRRTVARLEKIKPDANNRYTLAGKVYTKTAWEEYVKTFKDRLDRLEGASQIRGENARQTNQNSIDAEISAANKKRTEINEYLTDFVQAFNKAKTVEDEDALRIWRDYYQKEVDKLNKYVDDLTARRVQVGAVDLDLPFQKYEPDQVTPSTAQPRSGTVVATPVTATGNTTDISNITNKNQAKTEIARLRERATNLQGLVGEKQSGGNILYFEAPGMVGMSKGQRDAIIAGIEARIAALNTKFFAESSAAGTSPATTQSPIIPPPETTTTTTPTVVTPTLQGGRGTGVNIVGQPGGIRPGFASSIVETTPSPETVAPSSETPASTTNVPTGTPGSVPSGTPTAPSFTDPATGATYQPGQQVGGEDRTLPNGGAVVDGVYIPPGIDYTWLGQQVPPDWESAAKELYGGYYEMVKQYPELGTLLKNAIQQGWSDDKFQYELQQTNWWRTTTQNAREFETLRIQDPASAQTQLDNRSALLRDTAQRLGITLSSESLAKLAEDSIKLGLDMTSQLEDIIGSEAIRTSGGVSQLRYGFVGQSLRESASKYGVALSDVTFNEWVNKIAVGAESTETFETYAAQIARTLYPTLSSGFDRGLSFAQMTDPYAQAASRILEIPATQVDFTDPKWAQAFTMKNDKGEQVPMSYGEWADYLRSTPTFGWEYTDDAKNRAFTVANRLAELFGAA